MKEFSIKMPNKDYDRIIGYINRIHKQVVKEFPNEKLDNYSISDFLTENCGSVELEPFCGDTVKFKIEET